jgi:hypothetical protein
MAAAAVATESTAANVRAIAAAHRIARAKCERLVGADAGQLQDRGPRGSQARLEGRAGHRAARVNPKFVR